MRLEFASSVCLFLILIWAPEHQSITSGWRLQRPKDQESVNAGTVHTISVRIPNVTLVTDDANVCVSALVPPDIDTSYVTHIGVNPGLGFNGDMMFSVCEESGYPDLDEGSSVWDCSLGDRHTRPNPPLTRSYPCINGGEDKDGPFFYNYLPSTDRDSEKKTGIYFPEGTGVPVGGRTGIKYVVIDTHFYHRKQQVEGFTGVNEVTFTLTRSQTPMRSVRSLEMEAQGFLGPKSVGVVAGSWTLRPEFPAISILSLSGHSHALSVDFKFKIEKMNGSTQMIARQDPRNSNHQTDMSPDSLPVLEAGDRLTVECTYNSTLSSVKRVGLNRMGEMCVAYVYYSSDGDMSQMPPYVKSFDRRFSDCFKKYNTKGDEQNSDGWSSYEGSVGRQDCDI